MKRINYILYRIALYLGSDKFTKGAFKFFAIITLIGGFINPVFLIFSIGFFIANKVI
jgi:hypothetical protein